MPVLFRFLLFFNKTSSIIFHIINIINSKLCISCTLRSIAEFFFIWYADAMSWSRVPGTLDQDIGYFLSVGENAHG